MNKVIELGKAKDFTFTANEVEELLQPILKNLGDLSPGVLESMSEDELEQIAGGAITVITPTITVTAATTALTTLTTLQTSKVSCHEK